MKSRASPWLLLICIVACVPVRSSLAQTPTGKTGQTIASMVLAQDGFSAKAAAILNHVARENFRRVPQFKVLDLSAFFSVGTPDPRLETLQEARRLFERGKELYDNLELDAALDEISKSASGFEKAIGRLGDGQEYIQALLYLGAAHILSGDPERAGEAYRKAALYDRRLNLNSNVFAPSMISIFNKSRDEVNNSPTVNVLVRSNPPAAEVYLNGVFKGISPVQLTKVPEGFHFVRVEKDGYLPWGQKVEFFSNREGTVDATLKETASLSRLAIDTKEILGVLDQDPPSAKISTLGEWLAVELLVLTSVRQRGDEILADAVLVQVKPTARISRQSARFNVTAKEFLPQADAFYSSLYRPGAAVGFNSATSDTDSLPSGGARCTSDSDCGGDEDCDPGTMRCVPVGAAQKRFYQRWWFWTVIGGGLAVLGGTTYLIWYLTRPPRGAIEFSF